MLEVVVTTKICRIKQIYFVLTKYKLRRIYAYKLLEHKRAIRLTSLFLIGLLGLWAELEDYSIMCFVMMKCVHNDLLFLHSAFLNVLFCLHSYELTILLILLMHKQYM